MMCNMCNFHIISVRIKKDTLARLVALVTYIVSVTTRLLAKRLVSATTTILLHLTRVP